jgi:hypothetical protein
MSKHGRFVSPLAYRYLMVFLLLGSTLLVSGGCLQQLFTFGAIMIKGRNVDPKYDDLEKQKVVVVVRSLASDQFENETVPADLMKILTAKFGRNIKKVEMVDYREVDEWLDDSSNMLEDYRQIGRDLDAEMVVGIDLEGFSIYESQTLYRGRAKITVSVFDCETGNRIIEENLPEIIYPPNMPVPASERNANDFRSRFVKVVSDHIGRLFYPYDPKELYAQDANALL